MVHFSCTHMHCKIIEIFFRQNIAIHVTIIDFICTFHSFYIMLFISLFCVHRFNSEFHNIYFTIDWIVIFKYYLLVITTNMILHRRLTNTNTSVSRHDKNVLGYIDPDIHCLNNLNHTMTSEYYIDCQILF